MTCAECELLLAQDEIGSEVEAHVAGCPGCRSFAFEVRANADAMRALGEEVMPSVVMRKRGTPWWKWGSAAAALILTASGAWWASRPPKPPQIVSVDVHVTGIVPAKTAPFVKAPIPEKLTPTRVPVVPAVNTEPLRVKMLTSDPDVVIYWLID
jgi:hypothetical protein